MKTVAGMECRRPSFHLRTRWAKQTETSLVAGKRGGRRAWLEGHARRLDEALIRSVRGIEHQEGTHHRFRERAGDFHRELPGDA